MPSQRSEVLVYDYWERVKDFSPEQLCFCDESAVNEFTTHRRYGRSLKGSKCEPTASFRRTERFSILPLLGIQGIITSKVIKDSFNAERFLQWLQDDALPLMNPYPLPNSVLIMDNAPIHQIRYMEALCNDRGVKLVMLPPYCPDFNPIENVFGLIKSYLKRHYPFTSTADLPEAIKESIQHALDINIVRSLYAYCGYKFIDTAHFQAAEDNWTCLEEYQDSLMSPSTNL